MEKKKDDQIHRLSESFGMNESMLREMMNHNLSAANINEYERFEKLKNTVDKAKARAYFEKRQGTTVPPFKVNILVDVLLRRFLIEGGFELD